MVQVLPVATVADEQVSADFVKLVAFVPVRVTGATTRLLVPVLVTVTVWAALVLPGAVENVRLVGDKDPAVPMKLFTRFEALTVPMPVVKSHPVPAVNAGA